MVGQNWGLSPLVNIKLPSILHESINLSSFLSFPAQMDKLPGLYTDERSLTIKTIPGKLSEKMLILNNV